MFTTYQTKASFERIRKKNENLKPHASFIPIPRIPTDLQRTTNRKIFLSVFSITNLLVAWEETRESPRWFKTQSTNQSGSPPVPINHQETPSVLAAFFRPKFRTLLTTWTVVWPMALPISFVHSGMAVTRWSTHRSCANSSMSSLVFQFIWQSFSGWETAQFPLVPYGDETIKQIWCGHSCFWC